MHGKYICRNCTEVITQCRCGGKKQIFYIWKCAKCIERDKDSNDEKMIDKYRLEFTLPEIPLSLNKTMRMHPMQRNKYNKQWYENIYWEIISSDFYPPRHQLPPKPLEKAKIKIERRYYRELDHDRLVGSMIPVIDGLKHAGVILDDRPSVIGKPIIEQVFRMKKYGAELYVLVEEVL